MGSAQSKTSSTVHIVIIGGGYGGTSLAVKLLKTKLFRVTLIDGRDAMLHNVGVLRASVDEKFANKIFLPYDQMLGNSFKRGKAVGLDTSLKKVNLESGEEISYDFLVIASGTTQSFPATVPQTVTADEGRNMLNDFRNEVKSAKNIVVVGGGAVGVELSGEIKTKHPEKNVTLVTSQDFLVSKKGKSSFQKALKLSLQNKNIEVIFNDRVSNLNELVIAKYEEGQHVKTEGGKEIAADFVLKCTGSKFEGQFFSEQLANSLNDSGFICVDEYLKVKGHDDIFALGDVTDVIEEKMAYTADLHAQLIYKNFLAELKGAKESRYKAAPFLMVVPIGHNGGVSSLMGMVVGNTITKALKSKDLFYKKTWQDRGLVAPAP